MLVKLVRAQNIAREHLAQRRLHSIEDGYVHNYEIGFIHGQRSVILLPQTIITLRDEGFKELIVGERDDDGRTNRQYNDTF